ncbi:MAG: hypothetical protein DRJ18_00605 [Candidatus Methanomethylicota archaeon]|nr:MAG: hypothetical protein DRJ18_00605 [Candidatus Verstraetearchaeota archaeon]
MSSWFERIFGRPPQVKGLPILQIEDDKWYTVEVIDKEPRKAMVKPREPGAEPRIRAVVNVRYKGQCYALFMGPKFAEKLFALLGDVEDFRGLRFRFKRFTTEDGRKDYEVELVSKNRKAEEGEE